MSDTPAHPHPPFGGIGLSAAALALGLFAAALLGSPPAAAQTDAILVGVDRVVRENMNQTVPVIGRFLPRQSGVVAALINGPVAEFKVEVGDRVAKGDILAVLAKDRLHWERELRAAEVAKFQAALNTAKETLKLREQELVRLEKLRRSAAFSQARLEDKRQEVAVAKAEIAQAAGQLQSAQASLRLADIDLYRAEIRAPYSGVVSRRHTEAGSFVSTGAPVITLIDDRNMEIEAEVPARNVVGLAPGTRIKAALAGGARFEATVRAVVPDENPQTRTRTVRFTPSAALNGHAAAPHLAANQSVTLQVPAASANAVLTVHKDAVLNRQGQTIVFLHQGAAGGGKAIVRPVRLGEAVGSRYVVVSGLKQDDLVIVRGNERLRPGQAIRFEVPADKPRTKS